MPKVTLLGAGSGFTQPLFTDILNIPGLDEGVIGLVDIDSKRLAVNVRLLTRILELLGKRGWTIQASTKRAEVLPGTDYLINTIEVAGTQAVRADNDIPLKFGVDQCIGDTIGPGGIMKTLRTVPVWLEILRDAARLCPHTLVLNYTNPMSMMSLASVRAVNLPYVGLCHSVQGTSRHLANIAGIPYDELVFRCGGINHLAWFTQLTWKGQDVYPTLRAAMEDREIYEKDPVRFDMMKEFGYFVTESSGHFSEYVPYYRKRPDLLKQYCRAGYLGGSSFYADNWPTWRKNTDQNRRDQADGRADIKLTRGHEYAADIIEAHTFRQPTIIYASVPNTGLIPNLSTKGVVEVATVVDQRGFTPTYFGELPEQVAALCRGNMNVFELAVDGLLRQDRESVIHAFMLDPLTAAVCSPAEARKMAEELFAAEQDLIPAWCLTKPKARMSVPLFLQNKGVRKPAADGAAEVSEMAARTVAGKKKAKK